MVGVASERLRLMHVAETLSARARDLFAPLGPTYDRYARLLDRAVDMYADHLRL